MSRDHFRKKVKRLKVAEQRPYGGWKPPVGQGFIHILAPFAYFIKKQNKKKKKSLSKLSQLFIKNGLK